MQTRYSEQPEKLRQDSEWLC